MSGTVSTRWYFPDWISDQGVRACSYAARGVWMDLLCIAGMNAGKEHGFVLIGGRVPTIAELARHLGGDIKETEAALTELEHNRVFSRDRRGAIYSRRMVRAEKYRGNGRAGTTPNYLKEKANKKAPPPTIPEPEPEPSVKPDSESKIPHTPPEPRELPFAELATGPAPAPTVAKKPTEAVKGGTRLSPHWKPDENQVAYGRRLGLTTDQVYEFGEDMRIWATGNANRGIARKADWNATFQGWLRREAKRRNGGSYENTGRDRGPSGPISFNTLGARIRASKAPH